MNRRGVFAVMAAGLFIFACSPEKESNSSSSGNPLTAPVDYLGAVGQAKNRVQSGVNTAGLKQAVQLFQAQEGRYPKTLQELVDQDYLPSLPTPPAGQKFEYNASTGEFKVVRQ